MQLLLDFTQPLNHSRSTIIRTLADERCGIFTSFNPGYFCDRAADGSLFLEHHCIYQGNEFYGHVYRLLADTPWHIAAVGEQDAKIHGFDFDSAVASLISWRNHVKHEDLAWIKTFTAK